MLVSILFSGFAQHHPYFVRTTEMNGLSDNRVTCFYKDKIGYMWIGTESGLNRYNGNEFKIYKPNIGSSTLSNGFVTAVREDNKGNMWITTRNGLNRIDFASDTSEIVTASSTGEKLLADLLWDVFPEDDTTIWIVKDARPLIRYNPVSGQVWQYNFQKFVVEKNIFPARKYKSILKIANKSTNEMWLATTHGIFLFNKNDSSFKPVLLRELDKISFFEFDADRQRLYCADESPYFHTYDLRTGRTKSIYTGERLHGNASSFPAWALPPKAFFIPTPSGPALIGERDSLLAQIRSLPISSLYRDRDQVTWLATDSGFIRFIPDLNKNIHITFPKTLVFDPEFALNSFLFDEKANQWILTACWENKLLRINNSNGTVTELKRPLKYANDTVYAFYQKGLDSIFMLCRGAILLYNVKNETWKKFSFPPPFKQWHITCMTIDGSGKFWIGTRRLGLFTYNPATGVVWSPDSEKFSPHIIHSLQYRQNTNSIWIATHTHGAFEYNLKNEKFYKVRGNDDNPLALHSSLINDICIDLKGNIWVATVDEGLARLTTGNTNGYKVINYQIRHGLPGENVRSIASDQSNNLYFTSSGGIGWIDENGNLKKFSSEIAGLPNSKFSQKIQWYPGNKIATIAGNNFFCFDNNAEISASPDFKVMLNTVRAGDSLVSMHKPGYLSFSNNTVEFTYSALEFQSPHLVSYSCKLEGFDKNWILNTENKTIRYTSLPPGKYAFRVKAHLSGVNRETAETVWHFQIEPPFWQKGWFVGSITSLFLFSFIFLLKRREKNLQKKASEKLELEKVKSDQYLYQLELEKITNYFSSIISEQRSIEDLLWDVAENCISRLGLEDCVIYIIDENRNKLVQKAAWGPKTRQPYVIYNPIEIEPGKGIVGSVATSGRAELIHDTRLDSRYIIDDAKRLSELAVPIIDDGKVIGVIDTEHPEKNFYTEKHLRILTIVASLCADKIDKIKAEQISRQKEDEILNLGQQLIRLELVALRSQMNPHFIFNSLNSINMLVAGRQNDKAIDYLNKFSKLLRLVLDESENNLIALKDEIKILDLYLQLESLRFGDTFAYTIHVDEKLEEDDVILPALLVHPLVENAIWHGLLHKEDNRRLIIDFRKDGEAMMKCIVHDNGIGIIAATTMKQNNNIDQKSKGTQIVKDRLKMIEKQYQLPATFVMEDMQDDEGFISGTRVTITIPLIYE